MGKYRNICSTLAWPGLVWVVVGLSGCLGAEALEPPDEQAGAAVASALSRGDQGCEPGLGAHLPGIGDDEFERARTEFARVTTPDDGLGPIFNERSCGNCHKLPIPGGAGDETAERFGSFRDDNTFDSLSREGGPLLHTLTLGEWVNKDGHTCQVPTEQVPADATVTTDRLPPALFGVGLLNTIPDSFFDDLAAAEPEAVRGMVNRVHIALPDVEDPTQQVGGTRVGRLTWKSATVGVTEFAAAAFRQEVGISTQHCVAGQSITTWATDPAPNAVPVALECQDNRPGTDFEVGSCAGNRTEIEPHARQFERYMTFLAPAPRPAWAKLPVVRQGGELFDRVGCSGCHTRRAFVTPPQPFNGLPGNYEFYPHSDYLLHDVGDLGDHIGQNGETAEKVHLMKTAPLWGVRLRPKLLHDGRATDVASAIRWHGGQAEPAARAFDELPVGAQLKLLAYVLSL
ncbi:MAG TPA: di-heme oxidoredictase family protein [Polyangiaceae bacterium]|nr:di-heme oxidoredictase family protein [Polyangiaceae bacterium]